MSSRAAQIVRLWVGFALQSKPSFEQLIRGLLNMETENLVREDGCIVHTAKR